MACPETVPTFIFWECRCGFHDLPVGIECCLCDFLMLQSAFPVFLQRYSFIGLVRKVGPIPEVLSNVLCPVDMFSCGRLVCIQTSQPYQTDHSIRSPLPPHDSDWSVTSTMTHVLIFIPSHLPKVAVFDSEEGSVFSKTMVTTHPTTHHHSL
jgi:hypothetical protein